MNTSRAVVLSVLGDRKLLTEPYSPKVVCNRREKFAPVELTILNKLSQNCCKTSYKRTTVAIDLYFYHVMRVALSKLSMLKRLFSVEWFLACVARKQCVLLVCAPNKYSGNNDVSSFARDFTHFTHLKFLERKY